MLKWMPTRRAATPTLPPTGQKPRPSTPVPLGVPTRISAGETLKFWVPLPPSPSTGNYLLLHLPHLLLVLSFQVAGDPSGVRGQLCCALCCTLCCDWQKQPESGAGGPFCVLCLTGTQGSGPQGRAATGAEATQVSQASPEHLLCPVWGPATDSARQDCELTVEHREDSPTSRGL